MHLIMHISQKEANPRLKLECMGEWSLHGWVQSMASVRLVGAERDSIILTFKASGDPL